MAPILLAALMLATGGSLPVGTDPALGEALRRQAPALDPQVLELALEASACAEEQGVIGSSILTVIDYSLPSTKPRLWVLDLERKKLLFRELVSHGMNTGENYARSFSNREGSRQSSLGLFLTDDPYYGRNGYSLRLRGLELGVNHLALERTIVMHGAWYVSEIFAAEHGRLGRSWGCPALERDVAPEVIDTIKNGSLLFVYYPDENWLRSSRFLNDCRPTSLPSEVLAAR